MYAEDRGTKAQLGQWLLQHRLDHKVDSSPLFKQHQGGLYLVMQDSTICQRCHQPLVLDPTIANLSPSSATLITSALPTPSPPSSLPPTAKLSSLPPSSRQSAEIWASANGIPLPPGGGTGLKSVAESYILLSDSILPPRPTPGTSSTNHQQQHQHSPSVPPPSTGTSATTTAPDLGITDRSKDITANLHAILSSRTPISHPICVECTALLQSELQRELEELSRERDAYIEFQKGIVRNKESLGKREMVKDEADGLSEYGMEGTEEEWDELVRRKNELIKEEDKLKKILAETERELEKAHEEEKRVDKEEREQEELEKEFLLAHAAQSTELRHLDETLQSAKTRLLLSQSLLAHLESTNVYNDAFQIGHVPLDPSSATPAGMSVGRSSLTVGTINGLRLGGRPIVEWDEINAAWGLVALCVDRIAVKVGCTFEGHKICPLGSFSRIEELPPGTGKYELYASSDLSPARLLQNRRFNHALVSLLDLLRQLVEFGRRENRGWGVENIEIRKDRISGHSIKLPGISAMQMPTLASMSIMGLGSSSTSDRDANRDSKRENDASGEEQWTRACRAVLAVLKRILVVESEADRTIVQASAPRA